MDSAAPIFLMGRLASGQVTTSERSNAACHVQPALSIEACTQMRLPKLGVVLILSSPNMLT